MELTVKDLIQKLSNFPSDLRVLVEGYEGGLSDILNIKQVQVALNQHKEDWLGPHEEDPNSKDNAVIILRSPNPNVD